MKDFPYSTLNSSELYSGASRMTNVISQTLGADGHAMTLVTKVNEGTSMLSQALGKVLTNEFTNELAKADARRDRDFVSMRDYIKSFHGDEDPALSSACDKLMAIIEKQGVGLYRYGYVKETTALQAIFTEYNKSENLACLELLESTLRFQKLVASQSAFESVSKQKTDVDSSINLPLAKTAKEQIVTYLLPLLTYVNTKALLEPGIYTGTIAQIDSIITEVVSTARSRDTRKENQLKEAGETTENTAK